MKTSMRNDIGLGLLVLLVSFVAFCMLMSGCRSDDAEQVKLSAPARISMVLGAEANAETNGMALLTAEATTNYYIVSDVMLKKMWTRQPVMATHDNEVIDASKTLVSYADAIAQSNAIANLYQISDAASSAMSNSINYLLEYTNQIPASAQHISMYFKPDTLVSNLAAFVVHETSDGVTDTQYVWYNTSLSLPPVRFVEYESSTGSTMVKCTWWDWKADGETITVNSNTWSGVHRCTITRPVELRYEMCKTRKNDRWGGQNGFSFGSMVAFLNGKPTFTGVISNVEENVFLTFKQGALVGQAPITNVIEEVSGETPTE